jgi:formylglycine-generating enzyme required for sulfatase activity
MERLALLIGVSEYGAGIPALPECIADVDAMQRVLVHPEMGGFAAADITVLKNPDKTQMEDAIYQLFNHRNKEDLLLFYFSGHGMTDEHENKLYLANSNTRNNQNRCVYEPSAVAAAFINQRMNFSNSKRQVLILDCCYSGAFAKDMAVKGNAVVNLENYLGGKGRAILTSSTATEPTLGAKETGHESSGLSIYTRYLVEGIETGAADLDEDGLIAVEELHKYASKRVKEAAPAMNPKFYPVEEGGSIYLSKSPQDDPKLKYRREVEKRVEQSFGQISVFAQRLLERKRSEWGISVAEAQAIRAEVLQPYQEYQNKLREYEEALIEAVESEYPFRPVVETDLKDYQQELKLRDEDITEIEQRVLPVRVKDEPPTQKIQFTSVKLNAQGEIIDKPSGEAEIFTEDLGDGVSLTMVKIPAGTFMMGSPESESERLEDESPQHQVSISEFYMGQTLVTKAQWQVIMSNNPSNFTENDQLPVDSVSWRDSMDFCQKLSQKMGKKYRLSSEAEWEYACRAGTITPFAFGETITSAVVNFGTREKTTLVKSFPPNLFGLYDMHGNLWEWCLDEWVNNYNGAPTDGSPRGNFSRDDNKSPALLIMGMILIFLTITKHTSIAISILSRLDFHTSIQQRQKSYTAGRLLAQ